MAAFLSGITPKWYLNQTVQMLTKRELWQQLCQALDTVGMVYNATLSTYADPRLVADATWAVVNGPINAVWDYPDSASYTVNGVEYRPIVALTVFNYGTNNYGDSYPNSSHSQNCIWFNAGRRRADRNQTSDIATMLGMVSSYGNYGFSGSNINIDAAWASVGVPYHGGAIYFKTKWKTSATVAQSTYDSFVMVNNIHVILSKGGLFISVGNGTYKAEANNILAVGFAAHGGRLTDRRLPEVDDVGLGHIDPISFMPLGAGDSAGVSGEGYYALHSTYSSVSWPRTFCSFALGVQHGAYWTAGACRQYMYSVENFDRSIVTESVRQGSPLDSPKTISGAGYHMLDRVFGYTWFTNGSLFGGYAPNSYVGPIYPETQRAVPLVKWVDCWYYHGMRYGDASAQGGEFVDQNGAHWFILWAPMDGEGKTIAVDTEGITKLTTLI